MEFNPNDYGPEAAALLVPERIAELGPGEPNRAARERLSQLTLEALFAGKRIVDREAARGCLAGLWLAHDFLDESHAISQEIATAEGSYWHGIMHRREPDYSNAKYWFRRVGDHPVFAPLAEGARRLTDAAQPGPNAAFLASQPRWEPYRFIDLCEASYRRSNADAELCRRVAQEEWRLLFDYCWRRAVGESS